MAEEIRIDGRDVGMRERNSDGVNVMGKTAPGFPAGLRGAGSVRIPAPYGVVSVSGAARR